MNTDEKVKCVVEIPIEKITVNPYQPRKVFSQAALEELSNSIKVYGILQPITVRQKDDKYELIAGERRFRAAKMAGLKQIPVIFKEIKEEKVMEIALIENIQREDLNPVEEAEAYQKLMEEFSMTQDQVATVVGKSRPAVANTLRLLNLSEEVQEALLDGKISERHARSLLKLTDMDDQVKLLNKIIEETGVKIDIEEDGKVFI